ncbi:MAG: metallophosphoesterase [Candidatus Odinarchaeia archaeon]
MKGEKLNVIKINTNKHLKLIPIGDVHLGADIDMDLFEKAIRTIRKNSNALCILMGDILECPSKKVGGAVHKQTMTTSDALLLAVELLKPIKNKIIGLHQGNHEERLFKEHGFDVGQDLAAHLNVPYFRYSTYNKIIVNGIEYLIYSTHGSSGAKISLSKLRVINKFSEWNTADLFLMGHVHTRAWTTQDYIYSTGSEIKVGTRHYVLTGHFLNWKNSYADKMNLQIDLPSYPVITLDGRVKDIRVFFPKPTGFYD